MISSPRLLVAHLAAALLLPAFPSAAGRSYVTGEPVPIPTAAQCPLLPASDHTKVPWAPGEQLNYEIDVLGAKAGRLALVALPPIGKGASQEIPLRALAASNSFFSKLRRIRGRSTSYVRGRNLHPRSYREDSTEGSVTKWANVSFKGPTEGKQVQVEWKRNKVKGKRKLRYANEAFDPVSAAYYFRTIELEAGQPVCFDAYAIRKLWRLSGTVVGLETVRVPAGSFQAWHIAGRAVRTDNPRSHREIHLWISNDARRLPLAALGMIDLGPVRAQLVDVGSASGDEPTLDPTENAAPTKTAPPPKPTTPEPPPPAAPTGVTPTPPAPAAPALPAAPSK